MTLKFLSIITLFFAITLPSLAQNSSVSITKLDNGLTIILKEDHAAQLVGADIWVKAGSSSETPENNGVSHFIEHLVFGATAKREAGQVDIEMESLGATLDAHTSKDWAHFSTTVSSRYLSQALDVLADVITGAQFNESDIDSERLVILDEIAKKEADPFKVCEDRLAAELYGRHPYSLPIEGSTQNIKKLSRQNVLDQYHKYYVPGNIAVVLVGDFDSKKVLEDIKQAFSALKTGPVPIQIPVQTPQITKQISKEIDSKYKLDYLAIGFVGPNGQDYSDVCATDVLMTYLGFGYKSWMSSELRSKLGLASDVSADFLTQRSSGMISMMAAVNSINLDKAKEAIFSRIDQIRSSGISDYDLELAKRSLLGQYAFQTETYGGLAGSYGFYYAVSDTGFADKYIPSIQAVKNDDIVRIAQKYLAPEKSVIVHLKSNQGGAE